MIFEKHANLKYKYGNRHFWCRGYYVDTVGKNTAAIKAYIQNQLKEDLEYDQMSLVEYIELTQPSELSYYFSRGVYDRIYNGSLAC